MSRTVCARQVAEVKCAAELQEVCLDALTQEERYNCLEWRVNKLTAPCQALVHKRMV